MTEIDLTPFYSDPDDAEYQDHYSKADVFAGMITVIMLSQPDMCYEYDMVRVDYDLINDQYFYSQDSGCSCPTPFEDHTESDLTSLNMHTLGDFYRVMVNSDISLDDRRRAMMKLENLGVARRER